MVSKAFLAALIVSTCFVLGSSAAVPHRYPQLENDAWGAGERLTYAVKYGPIPAGTSVFSVENDADWNGRKVLRIKSTTVSADWFFYRVRDSIISHLDKEGLFSWRYEKRQVEGSYRNDDVTTFDYEHCRAIRDHHPSSEIAPSVKDVLGALYYVRSQDFAVGDVLSIPVHDGGKSYNLKVAVLRREQARVPAGTFDCLVIEPRLESEGIFVQKGKIFMWVTDDNRHIPVRIRTAVPVGSVVANLEQMSGVKEARR